MTIYTDVNDNYLAAQVTLENMESVAKWARGVITTRNLASPYIELWKGSDPYEALAGDWIVLRMGKAGKPYFDVYSNEDFLDLYREVGK